MTNVHDYWLENQRKLFHCLSQWGDNFLRSEIILGTMFCHDAQLMNQELKVLGNGLLLSHPELVFSVETFGNPLLIDNLDPNTVHHAFHLNQFGNIKAIKQAKHIVEFGGGYGNMSRIIRALNPDCSYTIIDLPEVSGIQKFYLRNVLTQEQFEKTVFTSSDSMHEINDADMFIATWSLSECPITLQQELFNSRLFNAKTIISSFHQCGNHIPFMKESTFFKEEVQKLGATLEPIPQIPGINYYGFKR